MGKQHAVDDREGGSGSDVTAIGLLTTATQRHLAKKEKIKNDEERIVRDQRYNDIGLPYEIVLSVACGTSFVPRPFIYIPRERRWNGILRIVDLSVFK